jgi:transposase-like protein
MLSVAKSWCLERRSAARFSSAPGFRWTSCWDIIGVQTQESTPVSNTPNPGERGRFSSQRKTTTVLRLLRGEDLELVSRELGVTASTLSGWRDDFLAGGQAALKSRPTDDRDDEIARLRAKVGELTMDNELLLQRCQADRPFVPRRRRR